MQQSGFEQPMAYEQDVSPTFYDDESNCHIFTPSQLGLFKKQSYLPDGDDFNLNDNADCSTAEQSDNSDLSLAESPRLAIPSKELPPPQDADQHIFNLNMRYYPTLQQETFIQNYINHDDLQRIKMGLSSEIFNDPKTQKFENWVKQMCNTKATQKEITRKLKVKKYLEKKHSRTYEKKVHYHIRQKVAEERLRIKGRFVTWKQAVKMLDNQETKREWTYNDYFKIKSLLNEKYQ